MRTRVLDVCVFHGLDSVDVGDQWDDEFRVADAHRQTSLPRSRRSNVSHVVAARSRVVLDGRVFTRVAAARYRYSLGWPRLGIVNPEEAVWRL